MAATGKVVTYASRRGVRIARANLLRPLGLSRANGRILAENPHRYHQVLWAGARRDSTTPRVSAPRLNGGGQPAYTRQLEQGARFLTTTPMAEISVRQEMDGGQYDSGPHSKRRYMRRRRSRRRNRGRMRLARSLRSNADETKAPRCLLVGPYGQPKGVKASASRRNVWGASNPL